MELGRIADVVRAIQRARAQADEEKRELASVIFFLGAGCSKSAGVPLATEIAQQLVIRLAKSYGLGELPDPKDALDALRKDGHFLPLPPSADAETDWYEIYDTCFLEHYKTPDAARSIFKRVTRETGGKINWAHLCLGEIVKKGFCSTVITTNFDLLALEGLTTAGVIPVVSDGVESLGRIDGHPSFPQLIQLNGSIHSYRLRNRPDEIAQLGDNTTAVACFRDLVRNADAVVFVGYGGRETAIMSLLGRALTEFSEKEVFWCMHENNPDKLSSSAVSLLKDNVNAKLLVGQDADSFFYSICRDLGIGSPGFIREPLEVIKSHLSRMAPPEGRGPAGEIRAEIEQLNKLLQALETANETSTPYASEEERIISSARELRLKGQTEAAFAMLDKAIRAGETTETLLDYAVIVGLELELPEPHAHWRRLTKLARESLRNHKKQNDPYEWAEAQERLGNALERSALGTSDVRSLEAAVRAYRAALTVTSAEDKSTLIQRRNSLGIALGRLSDTTRDLDKMFEAVEAFKAALKLTDKEKSPLQWVQTQGNMATSLFAIASRNKDVSAAEAAVEAFQAASEECRRDRSPEQWFQLKTMMASAQAVLGRIKNDRAHVLEAIDTYRSLYKDGSGDATWSAELALDNGLATTLKVLAEMDGDASLLDESIALYDKVLSQCASRDLDFYHQMIENNRDAALQLRDTLQSDTAAG